MASKTMEVESDTFEITDLFDIRVVTVLSMHMSCFSVKRGIVNVKKLRLVCWVETS